MILALKYFVPKGFSGITIFPFVFIIKKALKHDLIFINHERIHLQQQLELLIIPFFILYSLEFFIRLIQYRSRHMAYRNISFEREAYSNEKDLDYLQSRSFWSFINYL